MTASMPSQHWRREIVAATQGDATTNEFAAIGMPETFRGAITERRDIDRARRIAPEERDPGDFVRVEEVATPELAPNEVAVAVMASAINYNTVWSATFHPVPTFAFLDRLAAEGGWNARHGRDHHVLGSDAAGVVVATGDGVSRWQPGDHVVVHGNWVSSEDPHTYADAMHGASQRAWGFETNFGGLAEFCVAQASQILAKPAHLTWAEAASSTLCNATAYRMLISRNGARIKLGDRVLIWGATGGIGSFAVQQCLAAGAVPICVVGNAARAGVVRELGVRHVIDRRAEGFRFLDESDRVVESEVLRFVERVREVTPDGAGVDVVFEHPGRETMPASVAACRRGGIVVTCAATTGYLIPIAGGAMTTSSVTILGSHFANHHENHLANELLNDGVVHPTLTRNVELDDVANGARLVHEGRHDGKIGVLCLAGEDDGVTDSARREDLLAPLTRFARAVEHHRSDGPRSDIDLRGDPGHRTQDRQTPGAPTLPAR